MGKEIVRDGNNIDLGDVKYKFEGSFDSTAVKSTRANIAKQEAEDKDKLPDLDSAYETKVVQPTETPKGLFSPTETPKGSFSPTEAPKGSFSPTETPKGSFSPTETPKGSFSPTEAPLFK